ncbi:FAD/FMN-containing dehydrogenase [Actinokineospora iranica]|uniref:FAD/FMN-containing dehydrogenase n=1 Tax=Actinokineospora iranica TaxID=1271860 RepID=A0A1G6VBE6_9PSEU|nr:FAD/FMN-containing dehydrogenase [Actinokineospora iranica]
MVTDLVAALRAAGVAEASAATVERAAYAADASLYRVAPTAVAWPRHPDEVAAALEVCRTLDVPVTCRGAGTSIAGNAVGAGLVLDFSRHLDRVLDVNPDERVATVLPGVVHARLQRAAAAHGLRFGPDPSTHSRCTIGGMIGNNACGSRALAYGRTSDNVVGLDVLTGTGQRLRLDGPDPAGHERLRGIVAGALATIRTEFGRFPRQGSGYALEALLPENRFDLRRLFVGSEGTLGVVTAATVRLVADPPHRALAVLGYPDMATAADAVPAILAHRPTACEGLDSRIVAAALGTGVQASMPPLPRGGGWLFVETTGDTAAQAVDAARRVVADGAAADSAVVTDPAHAAALWRIREDGAGLVGRGSAGLPMFPGWEDSAVPPAALGAYLRELERLLGEHRLTGVPYGHFGDGCLHLRLDFPLHRPDGKAALRAFLTDAARLVAGFGGSLSGEHGDGRARGELLPLMYSAAALDLFGQVKAVFDPDNRLNPGVLVRPRPLDADIRPAPRPLPAPLALAYRHDRGDFGTAVHRCTGIARCRDPQGTMCPSFQATRDEKHSTRGRARILQEMVDGSLVREGWRSPEVHEALDLCLSCKACSSECPTGVDMAAYKAEVLHQSYRWRLRPRGHYTLGWLPRWARLAALAPGLANSALASPALARGARWVAGVDQRRTLPTFARNTFRSWFAGRERRPGKPVLLWPDTFTDHFAPEIGIAAVGVLEDAGFAVSIPQRSACCALTWISTGQLDAARRILRRTVEDLLPAAAAGVPIVGLEPSCTAVLRSDSLELLDSPAAASVAGATRTLAELLVASDWRPPDLSGTKVLAQPHCHHAAVLRWDADEELLRKAGADLVRVDGCCGLAGNFGVERGHYEVSVAVAETALLPAARAEPGAVVLADGFSCRTQLADLADRRALHLAELLAGG